MSTPGYSATGPATGGAHGESVLSPRRVLVIDDTPEDVEVVQRLLRRAPGPGYEVRTASSGEDGLQRIRADRPDCVLLDYHLPDMTGLELLEVLTAETGTLPVPVVMLTGSTVQIDTAVAALQRGALDYLSKDAVTTHALHRSIDNAVERFVAARLLDAHRDELTRRNRALDAAADRLARLLGAVTALASVVTPGEVASVMLREAMAAANGERGMVATLRPDGATVDVVHTVGVAEEIVDRWRNFPVTSALPLAEVIRTGEPIWLEPGDPAAERVPVIRDVLATMSASATAILPLTLRGRAEAAISLSRRGRPFDADERAFLLTLAGQAATVLERARAYEAERRARAVAERAAVQIARLQSLTAALSTTLTASEAGRVVLEQAVPAVGAQGGAVLLADAAHGGLTILDSVGWPRGSLDAWRSTPPTGARAATPADEVAGMGRAVFLESRAAWDRRFAPYAELNAAAGFEAYGAVPLEFEERVLGVLTLNFRGPRHFADDDRALVMAVGRQCAQALERARLYAAAQQARSEAEEAQARAEEANAAKSKFLATMSHELRTPLNAIGGYADLMELGVRGPVTPDQVADLQRLKRAQRHLLSLINEVLDFARIESGRAEYHVTRVVLSDLLSEVHALVAPQTRAKSLAVTYEGCDDGLAVSADPDKLRQVLVNLLSNATKFTAAGGRVSVHCAVVGPDARQAPGDAAAEGDGAGGAAADAHPGELVRVEVNDTGRGIPPVMREAIFEPFVQVEGGFSRPAEGSGLGLAISRELARGMGGDLTVESEEGVGSTFTLTLPRG